MKSLVVYAASGCNLRCRHCAVGSDQATPRDSLSMDELVSIIEDAGRIGVQFVTLIGGEVSYVHADLSPALAAAERAGVTISINTNLHFPDRIIPLLSYESMGNIAFSLDGATAETNDRVRGKGSFAKALAALEAIHASGRLGGHTTLDMNYTLNRINAPEAYEVIALANKLGVNKLNLALTEPRDFAIRNSDLLTLHDEELVNAFVSIITMWRMHGETQLETNIPPLFHRYYADRFGSSPFPANFDACGGTQVYGYVDAHGNHFPCPGMGFEHNRQPDSDRIFANVNTKSRRLDTIQREPVFADFDTARASGELMADYFPCSACSFRAACRPCTSSKLEGGAYRTQPLCEALFKTADATVPGFTDRYFDEGTRLVDRLC
ncbi:radical SAM protein [Sphingomonas oligophenolica]|uniref:Radical SAM protein n=1 Tax=Sphingomonas oligophenolica TaxID=301154 RepID=A0A502CI03_9SPHN|nr:radical SAM protein [Sphingomonas oligophenolica]TPG12352.1 radical SAM protein [Sphingomonas oligophenolica]